MANADFVLRDIDAFGRIVLPVAWRRSLPSSVALYNLGDEIVIRPKREGAMKELKGFLKVKVGGEKEIARLKSEGAAQWLLE